MESLPTDVFNSNILGSFSLLSIIRLSLVCRWLYHFAKPQWNVLYNENGVLCNYDPLFDQLCDPIDGTELRELLVKHFKKRMEIDNAPLNCALQYIINFVNIGYVRDGLPLCYWENSLGSILSYIYGKAHLQYGPRVEMENLVDGSYEKLLGSQKFMLPSISSLLLHPANIDFPSFTKLVKHLKEERQLDVLSSTNYASLGSTSLLVLGRYAGEQALLTAMIQCAPGDRHSIMLPAMMNDSISTEVKIHLINIYTEGDHKLGQYGLTKTDPYVLALAMTNQPVAIYNALYEKRKIICPSSTLEVERAFMMDLRDEECLCLLSDNMHPGILSSLAVIKKRSAVIFAALFKSFQLSSFPNVPVANLLNDPEILFSFPFYMDRWSSGFYIDVDRLPTLLPYFTVQAATQALRELVYRFKVPVSTLCDLFSRHHNHHEIRTIALQIIIEEILSNGKYLPFEFLPKEVPLAISLATLELGLLEEDDRDRLADILADYKHIEGERSGHTVLSKAMQQVQFYQ
jgi:hypothetical protein